MTSASLHFALLADGRSDRALVPVLTWLVRHVAPHLTIGTPEFEARSPSAPLAHEIDRVRALFRPTLLFVHRDAEAVAPERRRAEIPDVDRVVKVVPVRMTEAWLMLDEKAIRRAAGHPNGKRPLDLPPLQRIETVAQPKTRLHQALTTAAELAGRQRKRFLQDIAGRVQRLAELIEDYSPLLQLSAFARLERDLRSALDRSLTT